MRRAPRSPLIKIVRGRIARFVHSHNYDPESGCYTIPTVNPIPSHDGLSSSSDSFLWRVLVKLLVRQNLTISEWYWCWSTMGDVTQGWCGKRVAVPKWRPTTTSCSMSHLRRKPKLVKENSTRTNQIYNSSLLSFRKQWSTDWRPG